MANHGLEADFQGLGLGDKRPGTRDYYAASSPPTYRPPSDRPSLPQGWTPVWDQSNQRWFYANEQTGRTQWEAPGSTSGRPSGQISPGPSSPSYGGPGYGAAPYGRPQGDGGAPVNPPPMHSASGVYSHGEGRHEEKKSGKGKILLGAGAGIAVGLAGGALLHHALHDDSDSGSSKSSSADEEEEPAPAPFASAAEEKLFDNHEILPYSERFGWVYKGPPRSDSSSPSDNGQKADLQARDEYMSRQDSGYEERYERTTVTTYETVQTTQTYQTSYETVSYERSYEYDRDERSDDRYDHEDDEEPYDDGVHYDADGYEEY